MREEEVACIWRAFRARDEAQFERATHSCEEGGTRITNRRKTRTEPQCASDAAQFEKGVCALRSRGSFSVSFLAFAHRSSSEPHRGANRAAPRNGGADPSTHNPWLLHTCCQGSSAAGEAAENWGIRKRGQFVKTFGTPQRRYFVSVGLEAASAFNAAVRQLFHLFPAEGAYCRI